MPISTTDGGDRQWRFLGLPFHRRIVTGQRQISWSAVFILSLVWFTFGFHIFAGGLALTFTLQRYTNDPRILAFVRTINVIVMLGPFISYISDQVWTRLGRRRPFLVVAWAASCVAMFCFAFLPQTSAAINAALGLVGIPPVAEMLLLVAIITGYTTLADFQAPLEPLFLECVPPHQRGRFFAIRGILFSLAVLFFFQVLWPVYDHPVKWLEYWGIAGASPLRGEQLIYIFAGALFAITGAFLLFNIRETREPDAPNKRLRDLFLGARNAAAKAGDDLPLRGAQLVSRTSGDAASGSAALVPVGPLKRVYRWFLRVPIVAFFVTYFKEVFFTWSNYPFYIVLVIPGIEQIVWSDFGNIMQDRQFGYSKANQALWGFPMQIFTMVALTPFAGWYSDLRHGLRKSARNIGLVAGLALLAIAWAAYHRHAPADIRELPSIGMVFLLAGFVAFGCMAVFVWIVETMLGVVGGEHTRAWVSLLALILSLSVNVALYVNIQLSDGKVIPITLWMMLNIANGAFGALLGTFVGPMVYEYMPRSRMGTINAGRGLYGDGLRWVIMNLGGWWVWWFSWKTLYPDSAAPPDPNAMKYDYTSMYVLQFALFVPAIAAQAWFLRQVTRGKVLRWGVIEVEGNGGRPRGADGDDTAGDPANPPAPPTPGRA